MAFLLGIHLGSFSPLGCAFNGLCETQEVELNLLLDGLGVEGLWFRVFRVLGDQGD